MLDPGFGFGKTLHHNLDLSANLDHIADMGLPVMAGLSRKGMIGAISGRDVEHRQVASAAAAVIAAQNGLRCCGCMTWPKRLMRWPCCGRIVAARFEHQNLVTRVGRQARILPIHRRQSRSRNSSMPSVTPLSHGTGPLRDPVGEGCCG